MVRFFQKLFQIKADEINPTFLLFAYIFLIIASLLIVKPVRNSLFLSHYGIKMLPWAFLLVAVFASLIIEIYTRLSKKIRFNTLIRNTLLIAIASLAIFWFMLYINYSEGWFFFVIYIWVALFGAIATSQFWLLANYVFNARQAKRLFGLIGAGAISGGITGGYLTRFLAPVIGTGNMMLLCMLFLSICIYLLGRIWGQETQRNYSERILLDKKQQTSVSDKPVKIIIRSKHLTYVSIIVGIGVIVANLVDYQYNAIASELVTDKDELTAFFGFWLSNLSIASLFVQILLTGRLLKRFGVITSLYLLPLGILVGAFSILLAPALWSAILIKVGDGSFKQSVNKAGLELLIVPVPWQMKNQAKSFIDVFIDSVATGIGGILLIVLTASFGLSVSGISLVILGFIGIWLYMIRLVKWEYLNSFRQAIEQRTLDLERETAQYDDTLMVSYLTQTLQNANTRQLIYILELLEHTDNPQLVPHLQELLDHKSWQVRMGALNIINNYPPEPFIERIKTMVHDNHFEIKVKAIRYLLYHNKDYETIIYTFLSHDDYKICSATLLAAAELLKNDPGIHEQLDILKLFDQFINHKCLDPLNTQQLQFVKINLIKMFGIIKDERFYPFLYNLLHEKQVPVIKAAIDTAGRTRHEMFIGILINYLKDNRVKRNARTALIHYGNKLLPHIDVLLQNPATDPRLLIILPKVLSRINTQKSAKMLIEHLESCNNIFRYYILKGLNSQRSKNPILKFNSNLIENMIFTESEQYYRHLAELNALKKVNTDKLSPQALNALHLLDKALKERTDNTLETIFRLLGLIYPPGDIYNAYLALTSRKIDRNANAVEFLDNLLHNKLKKHILPIVEYANEENTERLSDVNTGIEINSEKEAFQSILNDSDPWLKSTLLYYLTWRQVNIEQDKLLSMAQEPYKILQETLTFYQQNSNAAMN